MHATISLLKYMYDNVADSVVLLCGILMRDGDPSLSPCLRIFLFTYVMFPPPFAFWAWSLNSMKYAIITNTYRFRTSPLSTTLDLTCYPFPYKNEKLADHERNHTAYSNGDDKARNSALTVSALIQESIHVESLVYRKASGHAVTFKNTYQRM